MTLGEALETLWMGSVDPETGRTTRLSHLQLIEQGRVFVNEEVVTDPEHPVHSNDHLRIVAPGHQIDHYGFPIAWLEWRERRDR